jgi:hypothetical protein
VIIKVPDDKHDHRPSQLIIEIERIENCELIFDRGMASAGNRW